MRDPGKTKLAVAGAVILATIAGLTWLWNSPLAGEVDWYPKCVFYQSTGLHCPGCGGTRAVRALVRGDLVLALRSNPMLIVGVPIMLILVGLQHRRERVGGKASPKLALTLFAILMVYFVARNFPSPTRSPLAPPPMAPPQMNPIGPSAA